MRQGQLNLFGRAGTITAALAIVALVPVASAQAKGTVFFAGEQALDAENLSAAGTLTPAAPVASAGTIGAARGAAVTPDAKFVYEVGANGPVPTGGAVAGFGIAANGSVTPVPGSPFATGVTHNNTRGIAISPDGHFLYASDEAGGNGAITVFQIGSDGALTLVSEPQFAGEKPEGLAVSPNGQFLFVSNLLAGQVTTLKLASDGTIAGKVGTPVNGAANGIAITPDGQFLFAAGANVLSAFKVAADGTLTANGSLPTANTPETVAVSQDGKFVYVAAGSPAPNINAYAIGSDGTLTAVPGQPFSGFSGGGDSPYGIDATPSGFVISDSFDPLVPSKANVFAAQPSGALMDVTGSPFTLQLHSTEFQSVATTPNQGPTAGTLSATPAAAGQASSFSASGAADTDGGSIASYAWDFGDGQTATTTDPATSHVYASGGTFNANVTVTDNEGCSDHMLFTGQTADCNGTSAAKASTTVAIPGGGGGAITLKLFGKKTQPLDSSIELGVSCGVACTAAARGQLGVTSQGSGKGRNSVKAATKTFKIKKVTAQVQAGGKKTLKLKLSQKARRAATNALAHHGKLTAKITVVTVNGAGDSAATGKRTVKLVKKR